jgi:hypothetical protein
MMVQALLDKKESPCLQNKQSKKYWRCDLSNRMLKNPFMCYGEMLNSGYKKLCQHWPLVLCSPLFLCSLGHSSEFFSASFAIQRHPDCYLFLEVCLYNHSGDTQILLSVKMTLYMSSVTYYL